MSAVDAPSYTAKHRYARLTARKARLIADLIRGTSVNRALELLEFSSKRAAAFYLKVLRSAVANASQDENVNVNRLVVSDCRADDGPLLNNRLRFRPGPQGRAMPVHKRTCHLTVVVGEKLQSETESDSADAQAKGGSKRKSSKGAGKSASKASTKDKSAGKSSAKGAGKSKAPAKA